MGPSGPLTSTILLIFVLPTAGSTRQLNRKVVPGTTLVSRAKKRPGWTSVSFILWCCPARVFITPWVPCAKPPCHSMVDTFGFQSPQVDMSDQIFQTFSGAAELSTDVPYSAIWPPLLSA